MFVIVGEPKCMGALTWRGDGSKFGVDPGEHHTWGFCNLTMNSGMRIGPTRGLGARW